MTSVVDRSQGASPGTSQGGSAGLPAAGAAEALPRASGVEARFARLASGVSGLGRRTQRLDTEKALLLAGSIVLPLGVLLILLGWAGAAHTYRLFEQLPYLISGGILGGALVVLGGFLYFGYWLTRLVHEGRAQTRQLAQLLERMDGRLETIEHQAPGAALAARAGQTAQTAPTPPAPSAARSNGRRLVATATGSMVHRPDCPIVAGKEGLRTVRAGAAGFKPCRICEPELR
jgi:hypothetical protein